VCKVADMPVTCAGLSMSDCKDEDTCLVWTNSTCVKKPNCEDKKKSGCKNNAYCSYKASNKKCKVAEKPPQCDDLVKADCKDEDGCTVWTDDVCMLQPECDELDKDDCKSEALCEYKGSGKCRNKNKPPTCDSGLEKGDCNDKSGCLFYNSTCMVDPKCEDEKDKDDCNEASICNFVNSKCVVTPPGDCDSYDSRSSCKKWDDTCEWYGGACYDKPDCTGIGKKSNCDEDDFCRWTGGKCKVGPMCDIFKKADCKDESLCKYKSGANECVTDY